MLSIHCLEGGDFILLFWRVREYLLCASCVADGVIGITVIISIIIISIIAIVIITIDNEHSRTIGTRQKHSPDVLQAV